MTERAEIFIRHLSAENPTPHFSFAFYFLNLIPGNRLKFLHFAELQRASCRLILIVIHDFFELLFFDLPPLLSSVIESGYNGDAVLRMVD